MDAICSLTSCVTEPRVPMNVTSPFWVAVTVLPSSVAAPLFPSGLTVHVTPSRSALSVAFPPTCTVAGVTVGVKPRLDTVKVTVSLTAPCVAIMVTLPFFRNVTLPFASTAAMVSSLLPQYAAALAVRSTVPPSVRVTDKLSFPVMVKGVTV